MNTSLPFLIAGSPKTLTAPLALKPKQSLLYNTAIWNKKYFKRLAFQQFYSTRGGKHCNAQALVKLSCSARGVSFGRLYAYSLQSLLISNKVRKSNNSIAQYFCILCSLAPLTLEVLRWSHHLRLLLTTLPIASLNPLTRHFTKVKRSPIAIPALRSKYL